MYQHVWLSENTANVTLPVGVPFDPEEEPRPPGSATPPAPFPPDTTLTIFGNVDGPEVNMAFGSEACRLEAEMLPYPPASDASYASV